jgi:hypothetical protein
MRLITVCWAISIICFHAVSAPLELSDTIQPAFDSTQSYFTSIVVTQFKDIYLLESKQQEIYRINPQGTILNRNGGFGWTEGLFDTPIDITILSGLNIIVADYNNQRLVRFDRDLNFVAATDNKNEDTIFRFPRSLATSKLGDVYVLDDENNEIIRLQSGLKAISYLGGVGYKKFALQRPIKVRIDPNQVLNILDASGMIFQYDCFGTPVQIVESPDKLKAVSLAFWKDTILLLAAQNRLWVWSKIKKEWSEWSDFLQSDRNPWTDICTFNDELFLLHSIGKIDVYQNTE